MATIDQRIYDAAKANEVLENEAFQWAIEKLKEEYIDAWLNSPAKSADDRESLYLMVKMVDRMKGHLEQRLMDGKQANLQREHEANQLAKDRRAGLSNSPYSDD